MILQDFKIQNHFDHEEMIYSDPCCICIKKVLKLMLETGHPSKNTIVIFYFVLIIPFSSETLLKRSLFVGIWCLCVPQTILFARNLNISTWQDEKTFLFEINHAKSTYLWIGMVLNYYKKNTECLYSTSETYFLIYH